MSATGDMDDPSHGTLSNGNSNSNSQSHGAHGTHLAVDDDGIAYAAQAAADAVVEADALDAAHREASEDHEQGDDGGDDDDDDEEGGVQEQQQQLVCRICERGDEDGRPMLRFLPVEHDVAAANAAPGVVTFSEDIALHIFCGKTASILQSVNQPDLEILTKAGLKNKHGIGAEVNAALARTRCAILAQAGSKEKHYYLVREFEAHLAAIRHTHINFEQESADPFAAHAQENTHAPVEQAHHHPGAHQNHHQQHQQHQHHQQHNMYEGFEHLEHNAHQTHDPMPKSAPIKASAGQMHKLGRRNQIAQEAELPYGTDVTEDGKIRCGCGGTHLPTGTQRGVHSWRNHVMTKRHQKWMEDNGLLGAV
jgi:hypothetical protein